MCTKMYTFKLYTWRQLLRAMCDETFLMLITTILFIILLRNLISSLLTTYRAREHHSVDY